MADLKERTWYWPHQPRTESLMPISSTIRCPSRLRLGPKPPFRRFVYLSSCIYDINNQDIVFPYPRHVQGGANQGSKEDNRLLEHPGRRGKNRPPSSSAGSAAENFLLATSIPSLLQVPQPSNAPIQPASAPWDFPGPAMDSS